VGMWTSCLGHSTACSAAAATGHDCNRPADLPLPPLTAVAADFLIVSQSASARVAAHMLCSLWLARLRRHSNSHTYAVWLSSD